MYTLGVCGGIERTDFSQLILWEGVEALKEPPFLQFLLREGVVVLKELTLTVYTLEYVVILKELIFYNFFLGRLCWF